MRLQNQAIANEESLRSNQNQRRQENKQTSVEPEDELPTFETPILEETSLNDSAFESDDIQKQKDKNPSKKAPQPVVQDDILSLEGVDLSFPMSAIQAKNIDEKPITKKRLRLPRTKKQETTI